MLPLILLATAANGRINMELDDSGVLITSDGNGIVTDTFGPGLTDRGGFGRVPLPEIGVGEEAPPFIEILMPAMIVPDELPTRE